ILNYSILNGALELLPQSLASMAIIPLQMKMVYRIGKSHGFELDRDHVKELLATVGVGLTSQYVEQIGRKVLGGLLGKIGGGLLGGMGSVATGAGFSFATTYALGQVAKRYYAGGRTIDAAGLQQAFASMLTDAKQMQGKYSGQIAEQARSLDLTKLLSVVKS
ncbi:MAG: GTPase, partial [Casimicrobiaceae bacterium]